MYKLIIGFQGSKNLLKENEDGSKLAIPFDPDNTDYQAFLTWCAEGNEPLPADEGESN